MAEKVRLVEESQALDSLRSSDFDSLSAYGEVIDNAIQAEATDISIHFEIEQEGRRRYIETLGFRDNGSGMSKEVLQSCLKLGWSSRFNDRSGIGRFGVGMILGAIHECRRIEVYSKQKGDTGWLYTYVDLDEIKSGSMDSIPEPVQEEPPEKFIKLLSSDFGTLVLWKKYDRLKDTVKKVMEESEHWIGRTFRHFIWDGLSIYLNGRVIPAHDPLYLRTDRTAFPDDPIGREYNPITLRYPVDPELREIYGDNSEIIIRLSLLPEEFRRRQGDGGSSESKIRHIQEDQEGISILRERREVFFGHVNRWSQVKLNLPGNRGSGSWAFEDRDRWWGCEVSFGAELDSAFEVKNIKRGANPETELKAMIKEAISGTRKTVLEIVSEVWAREKEQREAKKLEESSELGRHPAHSEAQRLAALGGKGSKGRLGAGKSEAELEREMEETSLAEMEPKRRERYLAMYRSSPFTIVPHSWKGPNFWEVQFAGDKIVLEYNTSHSFIKQIERLEQKIGEETDPEKLKALAQKVTLFVDLLLTSLAKTQAGYDEDQEMPILELIQDMNSRWGLMLNSFTNASHDLLTDSAQNDD